MTVFDTLPTPEPNKWNWQTLVFDCDGVLLNSNQIKTEAFRTIASRFGAEAAEALVQYHLQNGGISRYRKFTYLLVDILGQAATEEDIQRLANAYGEAVYSGLLSCEVVSGLEELRKVTSQSTWLVVSGGAQAELRTIFQHRGLAGLFDGGIYGSPDTKDEILNREIANGRIRKPALFIGDSRYDYEASVRAGLGFAFVYGWTDFTDWNQYFQQGSIHVIKSVSQLLELDIK